MRWPKDFNSYGLLLMSRETKNEENNDQVSSICRWALGDTGARCCCSCYGSMCTISQFLSGIIFPPEAISLLHPSFVLEPVL